MFRAGTAFGGLARSVLLDQCSNVRESQELLFHIRAGAPPVAAEYSVGVVVVISATKSASWTAAIVLPWGWPGGASGVRVGGGGGLEAKPPPPVASVVLFECLVVDGIGITVADDDLLDFGWLVAVGGKKFQVVPGGHRA